MIETRAPPAGYSEIQQTEFARIFGQLIYARAYLLPVLAAALALIAFREAENWRRGTLIIFAVVITIFGFIEYWRYLRRGMQPHSIPYNICAAYAGKLVVIATTGGVESPFLPVSVLLSCAAGIALCGRRLSYGLMSLEIAAIWTITIAEIETWFRLNPTIFGGGERAGHTNNHLIASAIVMTVATIISFRAGRALREVFDSMLRRALEARDESLRAHSEQSRELMALTAEIAHELKNPMASINGLASLIAQNSAALDEVKNRERFGVLRNEIQRMRSILDEFLNFSRPLVPLALESVDLREICAEAAALHEGMARDKHVTLAVDCSIPVCARCDPRKTRQIVINLLQNAIDAAPEGSSVSLLASANRDNASIRIIDRGPGLNSSVLQRAFEPGITTKTNGSGIGLTIARALARQHGGDLTLANHSSGGGCVAELLLPLESALASDRELRS